MIYQISIEFEAISINHQKLPSTKCGNSEIPLESSLKRTTSSPFEHFSGIGDFEKRKYDIFPNFIWPDRFLSEPLKVRGKSTFGETNEELGEECKRGLSLIMSGTRGECFFIVPHPKSTSHIYRAWGDKSMSIQNRPTQSHWQTTVRENLQPLLPSLPSINNLISSKIRQLEEVGSLRSGDPLVVMTTNEGMLDLVLNLLCSVERIEGMNLAPFFIFATSPQVFLSNFLFKIRHIEHLIVFLFLY